MLLSERMIALGSYEGYAPAEDHEDEPVEVAEVAFLVEDAQQGRGIGQLLLEHLAQAGRERGDRALRRRGAARQPPDDPDLPRRRLPAGQRVRGRRGQSRVPDRGDRHRDRRDVGREHRAEAASIESFFNPRSIAVIGASRRQDTVGQALVRNLVLGDYTGRVYVVNPTAKAVSGLPAYSTVAEIPGDVDVADRGGAGRVGAGRRPRLRRQGRARPDHHLGGLRRDRRGGPPAAAPAGRAVALLRAARDRAELPRHHQHRPEGQPQRVAVVAEAAPAAGPGSSASPARSGRRSSRRSTTAASASRRSSAPATAPTSRATTSCSTGRRTTPPRSCCSTSSRSATRASSAGSRAGSRCASRSSRCGRAARPRACRWATRCARSGRRRRPSTRCSARPA